MGHVDFHVGLNEARAECARFHHLPVHGCAAADWKHMQADSSVLWSAAGSGGGTRPSWQVMVVVRLIVG